MIVEWLNFDKFLAELGVVSNRITITTTSRSTESYASKSLYLFVDKNGETMQYFTTISKVALLDNEERNEMKKLEVRLFLFL